MDTERTGGCHIRPGKDDGSSNWNGHHRYGKTQKTFRLNPQDLVMD